MWSSKMQNQRPYLIETLTAIGLIAAPFVLPHLGFTPTSITNSAPAITAMMKDSV